MTPPKTNSWKLQNLLSFNPKNQRLDPPKQRALTLYSRFFFGFSKYHVT